MPNVSGVLAIGFGLSALVLLVATIYFAFAPAPKGQVLVRGAIAGLSGITIICFGLFFALMAFAPTEAPFTRFLSNSLVSLGTDLRIFLLIGFCLAMLGIFVIWRGNRSLPSA